MTDTRYFYNNQDGPSDLHSINATDLTAVIALPTGQIMELGTLFMASLSTHRDGFPVTSLSNVGPKGFTRGHRMCAGTLVFSVFERSAFTKLLNPLEAPQGYTDVSAREKRTQIKSAFYNMHADELPPFDIHIIYATPEGLLCYEAILGVIIVDQGSVRSMDLIQIQESYAYMATDHIPIQRLETLNVAQSGAAKAPPVVKSTGIVKATTAASPDDPNYVPKYTPIGRGETGTLTATVDSSADPGATLDSQVTYTRATWTDRWSIYRNGIVVAQGFAGQINPLGWNVVRPNAIGSQLNVSVPDSVVGAPLGDYLVRYEGAYTQGVPPAPDTTSVAITNFSTAPAGYAGS